MASWHKVRSEWKISQNRDTKKIGVGVDDTEKSRNRSIYDRDEKPPFYYYLQSWMMGKGK
jgi:hypothetical protein